MRNSRKSFNKMGSVPEIFADICMASRGEDPLNVDVEFPAETVISYQYLCGTSSALADDKVVKHEATSATLSKRVNINIVGCVRRSNSSYESVMNLSRTLMD